MTVMIFLSHYEIYVKPDDYPDQIVIKRFCVRLGQKMEEDVRFRRLFPADKIEEARDFLRRYGMHPIPRNGDTGPEVWMKD